jgi:hypothetical protein
VESTTQRTLPENERLLDNRNRGMPIWSPLSAPTLPPNLQTTPPSS